MATDELAYGDIVRISRGNYEVLGTVEDIYGPARSRHVVVMLTPELSGVTFPEPTTTSLPIERVTKVASAA